MSQITRSNVTFNEKCIETNMLTYPFFIPHLELIQSLLKKTKNYYVIGFICWKDDLKQKVQSNKSYPSDLFIRTILNIVIIQNKIINPPNLIPKQLLQTLFYINFPTNKLLIIDALMQQGSKPQYSYKEKFIYSEHSGVITINDNSINNIIVSTQTTRIDAGDDSIYLPKNSPLLLENPYLFHTHPNTLTYGGRISEGIIYEFPSANDVYNFIKYYNEGKALASIVVAPEGLYVIRPIQIIKLFTINNEFFYFLRKYILKLEKIALGKINQRTLKKIHDPDIFNLVVGSNLSYIKAYNSYLKEANIFIEYYPREKKNNNWVLRPINLVMIDKGLL